MHFYPDSAKIFEKNRRYIPGGVVSPNRAVNPEIVFTKGQGAYLWDVEGNRYIDYHFAFAAHFLGHNDSHVTESIHRILNSGASLYGSGTTTLEGRLAELICQHVPSVESVEFLNSGSEASYHAIRLARAITGRDHIIVMQGGYNGWHNDVACNLMTPLAQLGPRVSPGEYRFEPISTGIPVAHQQLVHPVNFNDLDSIEYVCQKYPIAAIITEPILQNIGVVKPKPEYLDGLRSLADRFGFLLICDEVKTGFRHGLAGYAGLTGLIPDLAIYGKAVANGYPLAVLGGKKKWMDWIFHSDRSKRVLIAGTYNAHPIATTAAIATIERLLMNDGEVYRHVEALGRQMQEGLESLISRLGLNAVVARQGSAFCMYFMNHSPDDWHDLAENHDFVQDEQLRRNLIQQGSYVFPLATKQCSISFAHTRDDIETTLHHMATALEEQRSSKHLAVR